MASPRLHSPEIRSCLRARSPPSTQDTQHAYNLGRMLAAGSDPSQPQAARPGPGWRGCGRARALAELAQHLDRRVRGDKRGRGRGTVRGGRALLIALAPALLLDLLPQQRVRAHRPRRVGHLLRAWRRVKAGGALQDDQATARAIFQLPKLDFLGAQSSLPSRAGRHRACGRAAAWAAALPPAQCACIGSAQHSRLPTERGTAAERGDARPTASTALLRPQRCGR